MALLRLVQRLHKQRKVIVTYSGSFDLIHRGHVRALQEAKAQGDVLVVLLNSDRSVRSYKGPNRPILNQRERAEILAAMKPVDYIVIFDDINPKRILRAIRPDVHCNGPDWGKNCVERDTVEAYGGKIHVLSWERGRSTTNIIKRVLDAHSQPKSTAIFIDRDGTINENNQGYTHRKEDLVFAPQAIKALKELSATNHKVIITTNQSGIGRGYYRTRDMEKLHDWMLGFLNKRGVRIDRIYHCPHAPTAGCVCRKPKAGMLMKAVRDFGISLNDSWLIGDDERDIMMGREVNVKTIKLGPRMSKTLKLEPHFYAKNLLEAVRRIRTSTV
ncbi:MAG: HAD-IIIA family hydrolase [Candidatus Kerfeldbacteria bacterium]|nr:HAD-IIIA family hydrolase [Candidatus Kerfeldbacteria bacterium]